MKSPELKKELKNYYLFLAPAFFLLILIGIFSQMYTMTILYVLLAYISAAALEAPGLRHKSNDRKYRLSFIKILFVIRESSQKLLPLNMRAQLLIGRHIPSLLLVNVLYIFNTEGNLAAWFLGATFFEVSFAFYTRNFSSL